MIPQLCIKYTFPPHMNADTLGVGSSSHSGDDDEKMCYVRHSVQ